MTSQNFDLFSWVTLYEYNIKMNLIETGRKNVKLVLLRKDRSYEILYDRILTLLSVAEGRCLAAMFWTRVPLCPGPAAEDPEEEEEEDETPFFSRGKGGGKDRGPYYNSYFPMMFGLYPGLSGGRHGNREDGTAYNPGTATAIANSFSTGRGAVATSHATAYGGPHYAPSGYRRNG